MVEVDCDHQRDAAQDSGAVRPFDDPFTLAVRSLDNELCVSSGIVRPNPNDERAPCLAARDCLWNTVSDLVFQGCGVVAAGRALEVEAILAFPGAWLWFDRRERGRGE